MLDLWYYIYKDRISKHCPHFTQRNARVFHTHVGNQKIIKTTAANYQVQIHVYVHFLKHTVAWSRRDNWYIVYCLLNGYFFKDKILTKSQLLSPFKTYWKKIANQIRKKWWFQDDHLWRLISKPLIFFFFF